MDPNYYIAYAAKYFRDRYPAIINLIDQKHPIGTLCFLRLFKRSVAFFQSFDPSTVRTYY